MNNTIKMKDALYIANTYNRYPLYAKYGNGCLIIDDEGKEYIDFTSGIGVTGLGHSFEPWVEATTKQLKDLEHISNLFYTKPAVEVAEKLCKKTDMKRVFFANSGAEANEGAIKVARKYAYDLYRGDRSEIITLKNSFHGRTLAALTATGQDSFHQNFGPFVDGFQYAEADNFEDLKNKISNKTLAIMVEIVQGEGGVVPLAKTYLDAIQDICDHQDILLIVDEVQTGIGRCGSFFAYMQYGLHPDIVTCAKGLGNGLPIAAILLGDKCADTLEFGDHGTTYGGNPVACAGASVVMDYMNDKLYAHVNQMGNLLTTKLSAMKYVKDVSGLGLMLGIEIDESINPRDVVMECMDKGILILTAKNKLRLLPPLVINEEEIEKGLNVLEEVLIKLGDN
ncbi:aspartate aminotransferase family protein [Breznakia pachnodae]|uniref:Acetylornithine aminotransferase n=1 Tax=Breznakia pachnodae TaxID=265178 RepID=A0ABU0DZ93_9FIRM|nr:aspartate aminotransferase family protein [Breznakia pachnodae]MDQ0359956.1 acetylornithine/N-succinyldiaminopimelate aminotransferase [Breznakia pachnodae]